MNREEILASLEPLAKYGRTALECLAWESMRQVEALTAERDALKAELATYREAKGE